MRPGQHNHNNKRGRGRNRRHSGSGGGNGGGGGGGNSANRVYDSNGPDVKLRGTAQTIAEKYMQLGRDAHSSGDTVMAESYYQFADHYYRVWLAAQPAGQPLQFSRRMSEEEMEDENAEGGNEGEDEGMAPEGGVPEGAESGEAMASGDDADRTGDAPQGEGQQGNYQNRQNRPREFRDNRDGGNRDNKNFRQRWPRRNDRNGQDGSYQPQPGEAQAEGGEQPRAERAAPVDTPADEGGNWEAPSFLKRPAPIAAAEVVAVEAEAEAPVAKAPRGRRPRADAAPAVTPEDVPQGE